MNNTKKIIVAVYGSLKRGFYNHRIIESGSFLAEGVVTGFDMFNMGMYPMVIPGKRKIQVELFEVDVPTFARLDRLEGFPTFYGRQVVTAQTSYCPVEAWLYVGTKDKVQRCKRVLDGNWQEVDRELAWR